MKTTPIQYADSSCNGAMGCAGCELWNPARGVRACYAGNNTALHAGRPGWPQSFDRPELFTHRIEEACRWSDLTGQARPAKPWLDGYPRVIFLVDEGDPFTESLPADWLSPFLPRMGDSPHVWLLLTKRPERMLAWVRGLAGPLPRNFWLSVSLTGPATLPRLRPFRELRQALPGHVLGLSVEPLLDDIRPCLLRDWRGVMAETSWVKLGGESRQRQWPARPCHLDWLRGVRDLFREGGSAVFVKQLGGQPVEAGQPLRLRDRDHGGDWDEWPEDLRVRDMPRRCRRRERQGLLFDAE
jgi:protein gp37